jgi:hypothetical protein
MNKDNPGGDFTQIIRILFWGSIIFLLILFDSDVLLFGCEYMIERFFVLLT